MGDPERRPKPLPEIAVIAPSRLAQLAPMFGRAFIHEPMMSWPLGERGDLVERFTCCFAAFLEAVRDLGVVWEVGDAEGAAVWVAPDQSEDWMAADPWNHPRIRALADDSGRRYSAFWDWVGSQEPDDRLWHLDTIAVDPARQGQGLGAALIAAGLQRAQADGVGAFLSTGTPRNVTIYERCGFRTVEDLDAPGGGPHVWFMRWDP